MRTLPRMSAFFLAYILLHRRYAAVVTTEQTCTLLRFLAEIKKSHSIMYCGRSRLIIFSWCKDREKLSKTNKPTTLSSLNLHPNRQPPYSSQAHCRNYKPPHYALIQESKAQSETAYKAGSGVSASLPQASVHTPR